MAKHVSKAEEAELPRAKYVHLEERISARSTRGPRRRMELQEVPVSPQRMRIFHDVHPHADHEDVDSPLRQVIQRNMMVFMFARTVGSTTRKKQSAGGTVGRGPHVSMCETA